MITHNIGFYKDLTKIIFQFISSNTHLISSSGYIWANSADRVQTVSTGARFNKKYLLDYHQISSNTLLIASSEQEIKLAGQVWDCN